MENFGKIKAIQAIKYLNESSADSMSKFMNIIKNSDKLQKEFKTYKSLEKAYIPNEVLAMKHIDRNVSNRSVLTESELDKIQEFNDDVEIDEAKLKLYESIHILLHDDDPDKQHEAYTHVLEHIKNNKPEVEEAKKIEYPKGVDKQIILEMAVNKFNEKYKSLNESEKSLFKTLSKSTFEEKKNLFESLKEEAIKLTYDGDNNGIEDKINEAIESINKIPFDIDSADNSIIRLSRYKEHLLN